MIWKRGDKAYALLAKKHHLALVLTVADNGHLQIKVAVKALDGHWYASVYPGTVPTKKLMIREGFIPGLDFE